ncbi:MAG TPA: sugar phosphate nucleotidyltransferase [Bacilli bacterium]|nr:sugar phosphate nucleotidyltransferase [Bacilli bacterium]
MDVNYIIIQAGGKGTRLNHLTANKPKGIVPVSNLPMIFHLMNKFPNKKFIIIGDYKYEVIEKYLEIFSPVEYMMVHAEEIGTCAGIKQAISLIPKDESFLIIWSDLIVGNEFNLKGLKNDTIGLSTDFSCRWSYINNKFIEEPSIDKGVAGCFIFKNKETISDVPKSGEFVRWLQEKQLTFDIMNLYGTKEVGTILAYESTLNDNICRPFNSIEVNGDKIYKRGITEQGKKIAIYETNWYKAMSKKNYDRIPKIYSYDPLIMQKIDGVNIHKKVLSNKDKKNVILNLVNALNELHSIDKIDTNFFDIYENYYKKTIDRLNKVRDLIPFANEEYININGEICKNIFFYKKEFKNMIEKYLYDTNFVLIHGDCTFSNTLIDNRLNITFIDPRGYFGKTLLYGDEYYDWGKLYYSLIGNYDQFNSKHFLLDIFDNRVELKIDSNGYEELEEYYFSLIPNCNKKKIKLLHAIIWLSLTTYAWEDYDSICGAFYKGLLCLKDFMEDK